jgi:very-short-patch-repair endonuclease
LDGRIHQYQKNKDEKREEELKDLGYSILRFHNKEILNSQR